MALADAVSFTAQSGGSGAFVFGSAQSSFLTPAQGVSLGELVDGQTYSYFAQDSLSNPQQREWGRGVFTSSTSTLARTNVYGGVDTGSATGAGTTVNFTNAPVVSLTLLAEDLFLQSDVTYYVATNGNDANPGTQALPWKTAQHACDQMAQFAASPFGHGFFVQFADGSYPGAVMTALPANGFVIFQGNAADKTKVKIIEAGSRPTVNWQCSSYSNIEFDDVTFATTGTCVDCFSCGSFNTIDFFDVGFDSTLSDAFDIIIPNVHNDIFFTGALSFAGTWANRFLFPGYNNRIRIASSSVTFAGGTSFGSGNGVFIHASYSETIVWITGAITGSFTGKQFLVDAGGVLFSNLTATAMPGSVTGIINPSGKYVFTLTTHVNPGSVAVDQFVNQPQQIFMITSDFPVTSSTTLVDVTGLSAPIVEYKQFYEFEAVLFCSCAAAGGVKASIGGSATLLSVIFEGHALDGNTILGNARAATLGLPVANSSTSGVAPTIFLRGTTTDLTLLTASAGTLTVQFAQNTANGTPSKVLTGSYFKVRRVG